MPKIAISGGIGSGKSTLGDALRQKGFMVLDADKLAKACLDDESIQALVAQRHPKLVHLHGLEFRKALADIVFNDQAELHWLERLIHPCVHLLIEREATPVEKLVLVEVPVFAALSDYDQVVFVKTPLEKRLIRLRDRGMSEEEIQARMSNQPTDQEFESKANFIFQGHSSAEDYQKNLNELISWLKGTVND